MFSETAFGGQPIGLPILGTKKTVRALDAGLLRGFLAREYGAEPRGRGRGRSAVRHEEIVREAEARLGALSRQTAPRNASPATYAGGERRLNRRLEQAHVVLGFAAPSHDNPDFYAAQMLSNIMGGGMSSRLFQEVREKRGLAYSVYSFVWGYSDAGIFGVYFGAAEKTVGEAMNVSIDCLAVRVSTTSASRKSRAPGPSSRSRC